MSTVELEGLKWNQHMPSMHFCFDKHCLNFPWHLKKICIEKKNVHNAGWASSNMNVFDFTFLVLWEKAIFAQPQSVNFCVLIDIICKCPWPDKKTKRKLPACLHKPWSTANPLKDLSLIKTILQGWAMIWKKKNKRK